MKNSIIICLFVIPVLLSCNRDKDRIDNNTWIKVKAMVLTSMGTQTGYTDRIDFNYDNQDRVTSLKAYNTQSPPGNNYDSIFNIYFEYSGNNSMPYKVTILRYITPPNEIHYLQYNPSGQPLKDSVYWYSNVNGWYFHHTSTVTQSGIDVIFRDSSIVPGPPGVPPPPPQIFFAYLKYVNNNFTEYAPGTPATFSLDFDAGENPLNKLNVASLFHVMDDQHSPISSYDLWSIWTFSNKNNITRIKFEFNPVTGLARDTTLLFNHYNGNGLLDKRYWCKSYPGGPTGVFLDTVDMIQFIYQ